MKHSQIILKDGSLWYELCETEKPKQSDYSVSRMGLMEYAVDIEEWKMKLKTYPVKPEDERSFGKWGIFCDFPLEQGIPIDSELVEIFGIKENCFEDCFTGGKICEERCGTINLYARLKKKDESQDEIYHEVLNFIYDDLMAYGSKHAVIQLKSKFNITRK